MEVTVTKGIVNVNGTKYTVYTGFMSSKNIAELSTVPSFPKDKGNYEIARDLLTTPVKDWQRPADLLKVENISNLYSNTTHDNIMPNGILLGLDIESCSAAEHNDPAICNAIPMRKDCGEIKENGEPNEEEMGIIPDVFILTIENSGDLKPLLILDGQHRIAGLSTSSQRDEPVAFVLCRNNFSATKMAEIFTHVTTEATPMKPLHKSWMQFAFSLGNYSSDARKRAGETAVRLCTEDGIFRGKIRFNDYTNNPSDKIRGGFNQKPLNFSGWSTVIADYYFIHVAPAQWPTSIRLAKAITNGIEAIRTSSLSGRYNDLEKSKIFGTNHHSLLCEEFVKQFLKYLSGDINRLDNTPIEWQTFFEGPARSWNNSDWSLPYVLTIGQNAEDLSISRKIASECFKALLNAPAELMGTRLHQYLKGEQGYVLIKAYRSKSDGTRDFRNNVWKKEVRATGVINICDDGIDRDWIHVESVESSNNWHIKKPRDPDHSDKPIIDGILVKKKRSLNIRAKYPTESSKNIMIPIHSYHSSSKQEVTITVNW